jgi:hypothetical protein
VGSAVDDGARVGESAGSAVMDGVGVRAPVGLGIGVDGVVQDATKSASAMKVTAFLISLPFLYFDRSVAFISKECLNCGTTCVRTKSPTLFFHPPGLCRYRYYFAVVGWI